MINDEGGVCKTLAVCDDGVSVRFHTCQFRIQTHSFTDTSAINFQGLRLVSQRLQPRTCTKNAHRTIVRKRQPRTPHKTPAQLCFSGIEWRSLGRAHYWFLSSAAVSHALLSQQDQFHMHYYRKYQQLTLGEMTGAKTNHRLTPSCKANVLSRIGASFP